MNLYGFDNFGIWFFDLCFNSDKQRFLCIKYVFLICLIAAVEVYFPNELLPYYEEITLSKENHLLHLSLSSLNCTTCSLIICSDLGRLP